MNEGTIFKALSGFYYVESADGIIECKARGLLRHKNNSPLVGDRVEYMPTEHGRGVLINILPRKNEFTRPPIANIDKMVIVSSTAIPVTDPYLIDRMTVVANKNNCEAIICINKFDLDPAEQLFETYSSSGFTTIRTSAKTGEGVEELQAAISGTICAFTGNSGVGKSSILNIIDPSFNISVGDVSRKLGRGRHTTRHVELYRLSCNAIVADTPGFSAFDADYLAPKEDIQHLFPDFEQYLGGCRFLNCAHIKEPQCAILEALELGKLRKSRYSSYVRLYEQASEIKPWENKI